MLKYEIPGRATIEIENIVLDYNGTIAVNGELIPGVDKLINELAQSAKVHIVTADTYGTVREACAHINAEVITFPTDSAGQSKREIVQGLGAERTLTVGNGYNDIPMFEIAGLSIAIIEGEGTSGKLLAQADIVARSILEGLTIALQANMVKATLRN